MIQFVTYDDTHLEEGKFYTLRINKSLATAVIEAPPSPKTFMDAKYIVESWDGRSSIEIWQVDVYGSHEKHTNITNSVDWYIMRPENMIVINSNTAIDGYIKFI